MAFDSLLLHKFSTIHENRFWNKLIGVLEHEYSKADEEVFLIGNISVEGKQVDAICLKDDAILVIDFKDYGGSLTISENGTWIISGQPINSGRKNPYLQLADNKYALLNLLKRKLPGGYQNWINIGHINAMVLFHQHIEYDSTNLQFDLSPSVSKWFNISDLKHVRQTLDEITSPTTLIRGDNKNTLLQILGISHNPESIELPDPEPTDTSMDPTDFPSAYYGKANDLAKIRCLIVGQDPYPTNPIGVAFCKNSHYELFSEGCSGGLVMTSLGITQDYAKANFKNPKVMFDYLLTAKSICFVNVFNSPMKSLQTHEIEKVALETKMFNMTFVKKAEVIVLLGRGETNHYFHKYYDGIKATHVLIHPSERAKGSDEKAWEETWLTNKLETILTYQS